MPRDLSCAYAAAMLFLGRRQVPGPSLSFFLKCTLTPNLGGVERTCGLELLNLCAGCARDTPTAGPHTLVLPEACLRSQGDSEGSLSLEPGSLMAAALRASFQLGIEP